MVGPRRRVKTVVELYRPTEYETWDRVENTAVPPPASLMKCVPEGRLAHEQRTRKMFRVHSGGSLSGRAAGVRDMKRLETNLDFGARTRRWGTFAISRSEYAETIKTDRRQSYAAASVTATLSDISYVADGREREYIPRVYGRNYNNVPTRT